MGEVGERSMREGIDGVGGCREGSVRSQRRLGKAG